MSYANSYNYRGMQPSELYMCIAVKVMVLSTTSTTIDVTWSGAGAISLMNDFDIKISWERSSSDLCQYYDANVTIISGLMSHATIDGLEEYSNYTITVSIGNSFSDSIIAETKESGKYCCAKCGS